MTDRSRVRPSDVSLRSYLLLWILGALALFTLLETVLLYQNSVDSLQSAHDRLLRATARSIGDSLHIEARRLRVTVPFALLEAFDNTSGGEIFYRVSDFNGELLAGDTRLPKWTRTLESSSLISMHDIEMQILDKQVPLRMAVLHQPIERLEGHGIALIQVAETLNERERAARDLLINTLLRQALMLALIAALIVWVVYRALQPLRNVRQELLQRHAKSLAPLVERGPREVQPVVDAVNDLLGHLQGARNQQQRLIANAAHQLRTPLAVLKVQLQSAQSGDVPADQVMCDLEKTVDRATNLTNQLLSLAKVEQMRERIVRQSIDLADAARDAALELSPLITAKRLNFHFHADAVAVLADPWMVGELIRNILSNAIRFSPREGLLHVRVESSPGRACLRVSDHGPGIDPSMLDKVFEPFTAASAGSGLGLAIAKEIANALQADIQLTNRVEGDTVVGLDAAVVFDAGDGQASQ